MSVRPTEWKPSEDEVERIVSEMRPLLRNLALRDQRAIAAEIIRRRTARTAADF